MSRSLKHRFREVDRIPSPWDEAGVKHPARPPARSRGFLVAVSAAAAVIALVLALSRGGGTPQGDASWLTDVTQGSCVEQYSIETLADRAYAFEGVISDVQGPADPESPNPADMTTTITFDVARWFWGGTGSEASRRTYATTSSTGELDASIGAQLLVSGDEDFLWSCDFTQPATGPARTEFEAAARMRET